jgi:hypothetical protein
MIPGDADLILHLDTKSTRIGSVLIFGLGSHLRESEQLQEGQKAAFPGEFWVVYLTLITQWLCIQRAVTPCT